MNKYHKDNIFINMEKKFGPDTMNEKELSMFNRLLNSSLSQKYDWFDRVEIDRVIYNKDVKAARMYGKIYVDPEWLGSSWRDYYSTSVPDESTTLELGDIIGPNVGDELRYFFSTIFLFIMGFRAPWINIGQLDTFRSDRNLKEAIRKSLRELKILK